MFQLFIFVYLSIDFQYLEKRFGRLTRLLASAAFSVQMILYMGIVHYAPALAVEAVTGISQIWSILLVGLICIFYSTIGGMKAVILTDIFQVLKDTYEMGYTLAHLTM